jgi:DNA-binding transcriptional LysR family regulator
MLSEPVVWSLRIGEARWERVPPGHVAANSPEFLIRLVCTGVGISALPNYFARSDMRQGGMRRVPPQ